MTIREAVEGPFDVTDPLEMDPYMDCSLMFGEHIIAECYLIEEPTLSEWKDGQCMVSNMSNVSMLSWRIGEWIIAACTEPR